MIIIIDTKEKKPFSLAGLDYIRQGLAVGDYSIKGFQDVVAIERKSRDDFYCTFGVAKNYNRFYKEMKQINDMEYGFLIVESTLWKCMESDKTNSKLPYGLSRVVLANYIDFIHRFPKVRTHFAASRDEADKFTVYLLKSIENKLTTK